MVLPWVENHKKYSIKKVNIKYTKNREAVEAEVLTWYKQFLTKNCVKVHYICVKQEKGRFLKKL